MLSIDVNNDTYDLIIKIQTVTARLAVDMKFPIHIHIHIHRFLRGYPWIYPYPCLSCVRVATKFPQSTAGAKGGPSPKTKTQTFRS